MLVEVPVTTGIIFRSIADIARSEGESIRDMDTLMACIEVFALGGKSASDDASESGYYAVRTALAQQVKAAADFLGKDAGSKKAAPMLLALVRKVAERLGVQYSEKLAAQIVPIVGALGGAAINTVFMNHFQAMARGHFVVRRLERHYGRMWFATPTPCCPGAAEHAGHAVSLAPGAAAATRQLFSAVSLAAEPGWSRAPRRLRAPGRGCTTDGSAMGGAGALVVEIVAATVVVVVAGADVDPVRTEAGSLQGNEGAVVEQRNAGAVRWSCHPRRARC